MPHIIVEYPEDSLSSEQVIAVLNVIHASVADSGLFEASHIKTRAYAFKQFTNAGENDPYIHVQARIKSGRDADNKKRFSLEVIKSLETLNLSVSVITVEVIDIDRDSYSKIKP